MGGAVESDTMCDSQHILILTPFHFISKPLPRQVEVRSLKTHSGNSRRPLSMQYPGKDPKCRNARATKGGEGTAPGKYRSNLIVGNYNLVVEIPSKSAFD
jgi:hypothetical protein